MTVTNTGGRGIPIVPQGVLPIATTDIMRAWHDGGSAVDVAIFYTKWN